MEICERTEGGVSMKRGYVIKGVIRMERGEWTKGGKRMERVEQTKRWCEHVEK